jgi:hypothetical protein
LDAADQTGYPFTRVRSALADRPELTIQHGLHTIHAGVQALRYQNNHPTSNNNGFLETLTYNGQFSGDPATAARATVPRIFFLTAYRPQRSLLTA